MAGAIAKRSTQRLAPDVNRVLFVKGLPFNASSEEIYDLFGRYGGLRQVRIGTASNTRGTAFVVYSDIWDAKTACEELNGFNVGGRYLVVLYYQQERTAKRQAMLKRKEALEAMKKRQEAAGTAGGQV